jgi:hypothetical protein
LSAKDADHKVEAKMRPRMSARVLVGAATVLAVGVGGTAMAAASSPGPTPSVAGCSSAKVVHVGPVPAGTGKDLGRVEVFEPGSPGQVPPPRLDTCRRNQPAVSLKRLSAAQTNSIARCLRAAGLRYPAGTRIMGLASASGEATGPAGGPTLTMPPPRGAATRVAIPGPVPAGAPSPAALDAAGRCAQASHLPGLALVTGPTSGSGTSMMIVIRGGRSHSPAA